MRQISRTYTLLTWITPSMTKANRFTTRMKCLRYWWVTCEKRASVKTVLCLLQRWLPREEPLWGYLGKSLLWLFLHRPILGGSYLIDGKFAKSGQVSEAISEVESGEAEHYNSADECPQILIGPFWDCGSFEHQCLVLRIVPLAFVIFSFLQHNANRSGYIK